MFDEWTDALNGEMMETTRDALIDYVKLRDAFENTFAAHFDCLSRETHAPEEAAGRIKMDGHLGIMLVPTGPCCGHDIGKSALNWILALRDMLSF